MTSPGFSPQLNLEQQCLTHWMDTGYFSAAVSHGLSILGKNRDIFPNCVFSFKYVFKVSSLNE